ncbi:MAG: imidazoleglycerol-phosphate dehydratase HisB [Firmicutes bacterium]|jgi:imidazoleglycerol-phosphate dehydratase|nr:imidazoleglycerol-phosphate dehydratase HisB [Bacillota bacterium]MBR6503612.1 imidazoleglycerol-phosphate dehydratase HisB [Bacillota bacterium]
MRTTNIERNTSETNIRLSLNLDGTGQSSVATGCGFLDHMLTLFARHGRFDLDLSCEGDTWVDYHHTVEDVGICLGQAFAQCLGDKKGICRYGDIVLPMDETLMLCAADISGRAYLGYDVDIPNPKVGDFDTELAEEFMLGFVREARITLHFKQLAGKNTHHILEAMFKALGRTLRQAAAIDPDFAEEVPSTKGVL